MEITFNPLLMASLDEFETCAKTLVKAKGSLHFAVAKELCSLSSEIRFRLGPPSAVEPKVIDRIVNEFNEVAKEIRVNELELNKNEWDLLKQFQENIRYRASKIIKERQKPTHSKLLRSASRAS